LTGFVQTFSVARCANLRRTGPKSEPLRRINLVFSIRPGKELLTEFQQIARCIEAQAPDISVTLITTRLRWYHRPRFWFLAARPTLFIETWKPRRDWLCRGAIIARSAPDKIEEYRAIEAAGLPLPKWTEITPDTQLDREEWGPYVVEKPAWGKKGMGVRIRKTGRVRHREGPAQIAQQFIYTGPQPINYRVMTYLGEPIFCYRHTGTGKPLPENKDFRTAGGGLSIVASSMGCNCSLSDEPDVLDLARSVHAALPLAPTLGQDIIRDAKTGELYIIETNPRDPTWASTAKRGLRLQETFNLDLAGQFGLVEIVAKQSIEAARRIAV
jgi:uncharacterized UPF0146 family protein